MIFEIQTQSRKELIDFGNRLGQILKVHARQTPWIICLGGDEASGKELLALAIDSVFNPDRYPEEIPVGLIAEKILKPSQVANVVFNNFKRPIYSTKNSFDRCLSQYEEENKASKVLIASNIERTFFGEFDYRSKGLESDRLDVSIQVHKRPGSFERTIALTIENPLLVSAFSLPEFRANMNDEGLNI